MVHRKLAQRAVDIREELRVHLLARKDLGDNFNEQLIESLAHTIERAVDQRVDARLRLARSNNLRRQVFGFLLAVVSMVLAIPLSVAVGAAGAGALGILAAWAGMAMMNAVFWVAYRY